MFRDKTNAGKEGFSGLFIALVEIEEKIIGLVLSVDAEGDHPAGGAKMNGGKGDCNRIFHLYVNFGSGSENLIQFLQQGREGVAEELVGFAKAAALAEGRVFEILGVDAEAGGDVVADEVEPGELLRRERLKDEG